MDYTIVDSTLAQVGTITDGTPRVAVVQFPLEGQWSGVIEYRKVGPLDVDGSGWINGADFDLYLVLFASGNMGADYDGDGWVTGLDFDTFTQDFISGGAR